MMKSPVRGNLSPLKAWLVRILPWRSRSRVKVMRATFMGSANKIKKHEPGINSRWQKDGRHGFDLRGKGQGQGLCQRRAAAKLLVYYICLLYYCGEGVSTVLISPTILYCYSSKSIPPVHRQMLTERQEVGNLVPSCQLGNYRSSSLIIVLQWQDQ